MTGLWVVLDVEAIPWELGEAPRQQYLNPEKVTFQPQPQYKRGVPKAKKNSGLDTISERPPQSAPLRDPAASTTELERVAGASNEGEDGGVPRKVQKGQINALAKMLSALRR